MYVTSPYLTPQERRRQKAMERQLPCLRPASDDTPADAGWRRPEPSPAPAPGPAHR
jgi:hypothetical protein